MSEWDSTQKGKEKIDYMFNRIEIPEIKELAKPFYDKALQELDRVEG